MGLPPCRRLPEAPRLASEVRFPSLPSSPQLPVFRLAETAFPPSQFSLPALSFQTPARQFLVLPQSRPAPTLSRASPLRWESQDAPALQRHAAYRRQSTARFPVVSAWRGLPRAPTAFVRKSANPRR